MLRTLQDSLLARIATKRLLPGGCVPNRTVAKLCRENGFHSRRKTILAAGPALGKYRGLTRHPVLMKNKRSADRCWQTVLASSFLSTNRCAWYGRIWSGPNWAGGRL